MGTNWLGDSLGGAGFVSRRSVRIDCSHGRSSGSIRAENRAGRSVGCGRTERTVEERSNSLWALAFGRVQSDQGPNVYDRETPRSIRTTLGSWGTDLAQIFHPTFIMPDAIDRASPYFSQANNSPDPHLETAPGSKTNLTDSFFGPTSSPTSRASASATRPPTSSTPLVLPITFPTGSHSVPKSGSTTPWVPRPSTTARSAKSSRSRPI